MIELDRSCQNTRGDKNLFHLRRFRIGAKVGQLYREGCRTVHESVSPNSCARTIKGSFFKIGTITEGAAFDRGHALGNDHALHTFVTIESIRSDRFQSCRQYEIAVRAYRAVKINIFASLSVAKGIFTDGGDTALKGDLFHLVAAVEKRFGDLG